MIIEKKDFYKGGISEELFDEIKMVKKQIVEDLLIEGHGGYDINGTIYRDAMFMMTQEECQNVIELLIQLKRYLPTKAMLYECEE